MDKKIAGLLGAISTVVPLETVHGTPVADVQPTELMAAHSFAELLEPIPNALALLRAADANASGSLRVEAEPAQTQAAGTPNAKTATYYHHHHRYYHHHHHHHHYRYYYHHHHHHYYWR